LKFVSQNSMRNLRMADAVAAVQNTAKHVAPRSNQMPNSRFTYDLDNNGAPDGWDGCAYAPVEVKSPVAGAKVVRIGSDRAAETIVYGPEIGATVLQVDLRALPRQKATVNVEITSMNLSKELETSGALEGLHSYTTQTLPSPAPWTVGDRWSRKVYKLAVPERSDRLIVRFTVSGAVDMAYPTWKNSLATDKRR
jgi:hypothetical protein